MCLIIISWVQISVILFKNSLVIGQKKLTHIMAQKSMFHEENYEADGAGDGKCEKYFLAFQGKFFVEVFRASVFKEL